MKIKFPAFRLGLQSRLAIRKHYKQLLDFLLGLQSRLATTKRYKQLLNSVSVPEQGFGRSEWLLSRPLYRFARFELKAVPKPQRARALELQIRQWTPFARTGRYVLWDQENALVWAWDADRVESAISANQLKVKSTSVVPETLLQPCQTQGVCVMTCMEGYEGQVWLDHALTGSRWWPSPPGAGEWINFQRDAGILPEAQSSQVPQPLPLSWSEKPWGKSAALDHSAMYRGQGEQWIVPVAGLCLFIFSMWYGMQLIKLRVAINERTAEYQALSQRAGPVMAARGQALETLNRIKQLQAIDRYPDQISLMGKVAESLPKDGTYLKEWEFVNGKLKMLIASPNKLVSSHYIKLFQSSGIFKNVRAAPTNDATSLTLNMETLPQAEIRFAPE